MKDSQTQQVENQAMDREFEAPAIYEVLPSYLQRASVERARAFKGAWRLVSRLVQRVYRNWLKRRDERAALKALAGLNADLLKDIGIGQSEIDQLRYGATTTRQLQVEREQATRYRGMINRRSLKVVKLKARENGNQVSPQASPLRKCS
jgi:uncharacterized protein YjiS (DUF1127 family)